ncbi:hypothetical protein [Mesorhizobium sp. WSM2239]|uniref:Uncharacterized protein n=2 Tax=unclassified Mesorhizobium TaxID=325217 RepID=A0AAU8D123_9HYPH
MKKTYNELAAECHANNTKWWTDLETGERLVRNKGELLMLVISEIAEAMEAERKGLMDDKLPHRPGAEVELVDGVIRLADFAGGFGYDLSVYQTGYTDYIELPENKGEALLRICNNVQDIYLHCDHDSDPELVALMIGETLDYIEAYARKWGYDLDGAYGEKTAFNKVRKDHTAEHRKAAGGKKW